MIDDWLNQGYSCYLVYVAIFCLQSVISTKFDTPAVPTVYPTKYPPCNVCYTFAMVLAN